MSCCSVALQCRGGSAGPGRRTREQFQQFVQGETKRFGDVIRKANVSLD